MQVRQLPKLGFGKLVIIELWKGVRVIKFIVLKVSLLSSFSLEPSLEEEACLVLFHFQ